MSERSPDPLHTLRTRSQSVLIHFLNADLDLAFTFLERAKVEEHSGYAGAKYALQKVGTALAAIRRLQVRIEDPTEWQNIQARGNALEAAISAFENSN